MGWALGGLLALATVVIGADVKAIHDEGAMLRAGAIGSPVLVEPVVVQAARPASIPSAEPRPHVRLDDDAMRGPMRFEYRSGGVLAAEGSIDAGSADRLAAELDRRGDVRTLSLNSPGGSLDDAMRMAELVREKGIATLVPGGGLCASSCPLVLAGGVTRRAGEGAMIGLHQFYAPAQMAANPAQAMSDAQATAARIARYLMRMGVDSTLWLHALDTPPHTLYYLSTDEMRKYRLVTTGETLASAS